MRSMLEVENVFVDVAAADAAMHFDLHEIAQSQAHPLCLLCKFARWGQNQNLWLPQGQIDSLKRAECKHARFTGAALTLDNDVATSDDWKDSPLLHC